jgi:hypothetical protein
VVCRRNLPVAELRPRSVRPKAPRRVGVLRGRIKVPKSFFDPLPDELLDAFEGKGE